MRDRMERVRIWLVVGTSVLVLLVVGFLGYSRYRAKAFLAGLPGKLGAEITRETDGYTYSQTLQGRTVFTLRAAKMEQRKDGVVKLHDVGVVLYGRKHDRADRIYGKEFEYDQEKGIVRALGEVHMDLQAPSPVEGSGKKQRPVSATEGELATGNPRVIHVLTSGLVYLTNLQVVATSEDVEFSEGALTGRAHGADYSSDTGIVTLQSAVRVNGLVGGGPMALTANRAELDQMNNQATFAGAKVVMPEETVEASRAIVHVRKDGSPERIEGAGSVKISRRFGGVVTAENAETTINAANKPVDVRLWGGVRYADDEEGKRTQGQAAEVRVRFNGAGEPEHGTATGGVSADERETAGAGSSSRVLTARTVDVVLGQGTKKGKSEIRSAEAVGGARLVAADDAAGTGKPVRTEMAGDVLKAQVLGGRRISNVLGTGHTVLHRIGADGIEETSGGDTTELVFRTGSGTAHVAAKDVSAKVLGSGGRKVGGSQAASGGGVEELASAVQAGHVSMVRRSVKMQGAGGNLVEERSKADRAVYDGDTDRATLTGGVMVTDAESTLWAAKVVVDRVTGDATAEGAVRVTYAQDPRGGKEGEPVHVLASRAELRGEGAGATAPGKAAAHRAFFYGSAGRMVRMWQGTSQVEAPEIELEQGARRMTGRSVGEAMQVHTVMLSGGDAAGRQSNSARGKKQDSPSVVRILSHEMVYADGMREAAFTGGVVVEDADGRMKAQRATVYLQPAKSGGVTAEKGAPDLFSGGNVDHIIATGKVEIDQPGRYGTGEQLVYTANDGMFVLTGTATTPPRMEDEAKGTVTGGTMRFHAGDDRVVVTGEGIQSGGTGSGAKRRTETRVKQ